MLVSLKKQKYTLHILLSLAKFALLWVFFKKITIQKVPVWIH